MVRFAFFRLKRLKPAKDSVLLDQQLDGDLSTIPDYSSTNFSNYAAPEPLECSNQITTESTSIRSGFEQKGDDFFLPAAATAETTTIKAEHRVPQSCEHNDEVYNFSERPQQVSYRGFSSSISHIFISPSSRTVDFCSLVCCGVLQWEYNKHIASGGRFKSISFFGRFIRYIFIPLFIFCVAGYCAVIIRDYTVNEVVSTFLVFFALGWVLSCSFKSSSQRGRFRTALIKWLSENGNQRLVHSGAHYTVDDDIEEAPLNYDNSGDKVRCAACIHRTCACYPVDYDDYNDESSYGNRDFDVCSAFSYFFSRLCCGVLCGCWLQLCGICALAQEARELHRIIPAEKRRIDYVTFERFVEYYCHIERIRVIKDGSLCNHYRAISKLSRMLLKTLGVITFVLLLVSMISHATSFQIGNMLVFVATFFQAFATLFLVHWYWHKFDLSLDAVIKYFASGFIICTSVVLIFEAIQTIFLQIALLVIMMLSDVDIERQSSFQRYQNLSGDSIRMSDWADFKLAFSREYPIVIAIYLFLGAFFVAAATEELCKYFCFHIVEHPDFLTKEQLNSGLLSTAVASVDASSNDSVNDYFSLSAHDQCEIGVTDRSSFEHKTNQSRSAAITVAMVAVSLGFACCENLVYIFLYNGSSVSTELSVLVARSLFPVHPLCAAIQSLGVRESLFQRQRPLGRIIFPAILLHGSYDYSIMLLSFLSTLSGNGDIDSENHIYSTLSVVLSFGFVILGFLFYFVSSAHLNKKIEITDATQSTIV